MGEAAVKQQLLHRMVPIYHVQECGLYSKSNGVSLVISLLLVDVCLIEIALAETGGRSQ